MKTVKKFSDKALLVVSFTVFLDMLGFGILVPIIPLLIVDQNVSYSLLSPLVSSDSRYIILGLLIALFPFAQLISTPVLGDISDQIGRKKVLVFSIIGTCISYLLMILGVEAKSIVLLLIARTLDGISGGNLSVAQAVVADISKNENRTRNFAFLSAAFGLGFVLGPIVGTHLKIEALGLSAPFVLAFVLSLVNVVCLLVLLPETLKKKRKDKTIRLGKAISHIKSALLMRGIRLYFAVNFLLQGAFATLTAFLSVFVVNRANLTTGQFGFVLSYLGVWMVIGQLFFTKLFVRRFGELKAFYICLVCLSLSVALLLAAHSFVSFLFFTPFVSIFLGLSHAFLLSLLSSSVSMSKQGEVLGINNSVTALAQTIPPVLAGLAAAAFSPITPIIIAALFSLAASLLVRRRYRFAVL